MMWKELSKKSVLQPAKTGLLILLALAAIATLNFQNGAALEASGKPEDTRQALLDAVAGGDLTVAERLLEAGADPSWAIGDATRRADLEALRWLFDHGAAAVGRPGSRALLRALRSGNAELVALIRANGGDLDASDPSGTTLMMSMAAATAKEKRAYRILSALIDAGADVDRRSLAGRTALMLAVKTGRLKVVRRLLEAGAEVDARDSDGWTPLMLAARDGLSKIVDRLLAAGADPNARSDAGWTPLMWAAWHGQLGVVEELLEAGADPNQVSHAGGTALVRAVQTGRRHVVAALLNGGALPEGEFAGLDAAAWARQSGKIHLARVLEGVGSE